MSTPLSCWTVSRACSGTDDPRLQEFRRIAQELRKPEILKLAILLHDIGKGEGHGHSERGVAIAEAVLTRLGLPPEDVAAVTFLVAQHLSMAHIAERRDLDDERLIIEFARLVEAEELLRMLYLLTYLDINAVGPEVWTDWKGTLLWELFIKTHTILTRGVPEGEAERRRAQSLRAAWSRNWAATSAPRWSDSTSTSCRSGTSSHLRRQGRPAPPAHRSRAPRGARRGPLVRLPPGRLFGGAGMRAGRARTLLQRRRDAHGPRHQYPLRTALQPGRRGHDPRLPGERRARSRPRRTRPCGTGFGHDLRGVILGQVSVRELIRSLRRDLLAKPVPRAHEIHTRVEFDNVVSDRFTVIDIRAQDRLGLLYVIASTLSGLDVDVTLAKIATEVDQAVDVFYVTEKDGRKVAEPARMDAIRQALVHAIADGIA